MSGGNDVEPGECSPGRVGKRGAGLGEEATEATRGGRLGGEIVGKGKAGFWLSLMVWAVLVMGLPGGSG